MPLHGSLRSLVLPAFLVAVGVPASLSCSTFPAQGGLYVVEAESGRRSTDAGASIPYRLFVPEASPYLEPPPWPAVILVHGFGRSHRYQHDNARYLAERGMVVLTPDLVSLLGGERSQFQNIGILADHVHWLRRRAATPGDSLERLIDPQRVALAGHSAGGAIAFETAIDLQQASAPVQALCLLDGVPWERTVARAPDLSAMAFATLRSEPSICNADGLVLELLGAMSFTSEDVKIMGASHCDAEDPTDGLCVALCEGTSHQARSIYQDLLYRFLAESLAAPVLEYEPVTYRDQLNAYEAQEQIRRTVVAAD